jgi:hypothetical protein
MLFFMAVVLAQPSRAVTAEGRSRLMFMTSAYGVMLGALSGLATLAFYESPSTKTRNIALGASLGLYTGVLLGTYMIYLKPDPNAPQDTSNDDEEANLDFLSDQQLPVATVHDYILAPQFSVTPDGRTPTVGFLLRF